MKLDLNASVRPPLAGLLKRLLFVPRVTFLDQQGLLDVVNASKRKFELLHVVGSSIKSPDSNLLSIAARCADHIWIDTDTERMAHPVVGTLKGLTTVLDDFCSGQNSGTLRIEWLENNLNEFVHRTLTFQLDRDATVLQAPNLLFSSPRDDWYDISLKMARAAASEAGGPIVVKLTTLPECIVQNRYRDKIVQDYTSLPVAFYYLQIEHTDMATTLEIDRAYVDLVQRLSEHAPVLPGRVGFFGLVCAGLGSAGFGAGLEFAESFRRDVLTEGGGSHGTSKYHVDDAMLVLKTDVVDASTFQHYPCSRDGACKGRLASKLDKLERTIHRIEMFRRHLEAMTPLNGQGRRQYMLEMVDAAIVAITQNSLHDKSAGLSVHADIWRLLLV